MGRLGFMRWSGEREAVEARPNLGGRSGKGRFKLKSDACFTVVAASLGQRHSIPKRDYHAVTVGEGALYA